MKVGDHAEPFRRFRIRRLAPQLAIEFARGRGGWLAIPKAGVLVTPASWLLFGVAWLDRRGPARRRTVTLAARLGVRPPIAGP